VAGVGAAAVVLGVAMVVAPRATLGDDGRWLLQVVQSRRSPADVPLEVSG